MDEFQVAASVFWLSFFANQRGCPLSLRPSLLAQLIPSEKNGFYQKKDFENEFDEIHDRVMNLWRNSLKAVSDAWLETEAGEAYVDECAHQRFISHLRNLILQGRMVKSFLSSKISQCRLRSLLSEERNTKACKSTTFTFPGSSIPP
jgi:hypothetical protein